MIGRRMLTDEPVKVIESASLAFQAIIHMKATDHMQSLQPPID
jgi:hypothetical protein